MTTDEFFEQETLPQRMAIIGLGVIGTELGQSLARLGWILPALTWRRRWAVCLILMCAMKPFV